MVGAFRLNAHLLQHQADLPPDVLALVRRSDVHVTGTVVGFLGGVAVLIGLEQVELHFGAEGEGVALGLRLCHRFFQDRSAVRGERGAVRVSHLAEHPHHAADLRPPGECHQGGGIRMEEQVGAHRTAEAGDGGGIEGDAGGERLGQFTGQDGNVLLSSKNIAEGQADELHFHLTDVLHHFFSGIISHIMPLSRSLVGKREDVRREKRAHFSCRNVSVHVKYHTLSTGFCQ